MNQFFPYRPFYARIDFLTADLYRFEKPTSLSEVDVTLDSSGTCRVTCIANKGKESGEHCSIFDFRWWNKLTGTEIDRGNDSNDKTKSKSRRRSDTDLAQLGQGGRPLELIGHALYATSGICAALSASRSSGDQWILHYDPVLISAVSISGTSWSRRLTRPRRYCRRKDRPITE